MERLGGGLFSRLRRDTRGVSAVEFALIAPVMILLYFGLAEFCQGYMAQKRMGHATSLVADLIAQQDVITGGEIDDIFMIGALVMKPFSSATLKMSVSSVTRGADGVARVTWSRDGGLPARAKDEVVAVPAGVIDTAGETVVMSEATYDYASPANYVLKGVTKFKQTFYLRPRSVERILYTP